MLSPKMQKLEDAKALVAELEHAVAAELASLHTVYGYESVDEFIVAVRVAKRGKGPGRPRKAALGKKTRRRAKITDETRAEVKSLVKSGKTGAEIAKALKISLPSVQNIKKALGLVRSKKAAAAAKPAAKKKAKKAPKSAKPKRTAKPKKKAKAKAPKAPKAPKTVDPEPAPAPTPAPAEPAPPAAT